MTSLRSLRIASVWTFLLLLSSSYHSQADPEVDRIAHLPGYGEPPTPQWSGLLDGGNGTKLHYWLAAAEANDYTEKPLVLWLNGGPGSSSLIGMLQEQGPLIFGRENDDNDKLLFENPYAWTKVANLVAIESPAGVGYSYCADSFKQGGACHNDDDSTAKALHKALQDLIHNKFPELALNEFFISGESYAGVYCPTLAREILLENERVGRSQQARINLVGMAVGDPCTDNDSQATSMDMLWYGHKYGFVPDDEFNLLYHECGARYDRLQMQEELSVDYSGQMVGTTRLKHLQKDSNQDESPRRLGNSLVVPSFRRQANETCRLAHRKFLLQTSRGFSQNWERGFINDLTLFGPSAVVGSNQEGSLNYRMAQWMMSKEVREALHVAEVPTTEWPGPSAGWTYKKQYNACNAGAPNGAPSMIDLYRFIAPRIKGSVLIYNGDTDPCVTYEGTRVAVQRVGFAQLRGGSYRPWFYNATADSAKLLNEKDLLFGPSLSMVAGGPQLGGHVVDYEHGLKFCTVHGSGHMVPQFRPRAALKMLAGVLSGNPLSPLLPNNEDLVAMSDEEYNAFLDKWTDTAKLMCDVSGE